MTKELVTKVVGNIHDRVVSPVHNRTVPGGSEERDGIIFRDTRLHRVTDIIASALTRKLEVRGGENLAAIERLVNEGKRVVFASLHEAHLDAVALDQSLEQEGYKHLAFMLVHMFGIRLEKGKTSRIFSESQNRIRLWPPFDQPTTPEEKARKALLAASAPEAAKEALDMGLLINIFPQGTRAGDDRQVLKGLPAVVGFFDAIETDFIVPVTIDGTQNVLPRKKLPRIGSYSVTYGQPIDFHELKARYGHLQHKPFREAVLYDIMSAIASPLPPERQGPYRQSEHDASY